MKWLITGGAGFIGTNLISYLLKQKEEINIRVLDNLSVGSLEDLARICTFKEINRNDILSAGNKFSNTEVELLTGDIKDPNTCIDAARGMETIVHLAANTGVAPSVSDPRADMEANVIGTFNMLEAAKENKSRAFIFASSGAPVGEVEPPIHEELAPHPVSPYGASKLAGEAYCSAYKRSFGLNSVILRFGNVFGPRSKNKSSVVAKFIQQSLKGEALEIYGDGTQTRDFHLC